MNKNVGKMEWEESKSVLFWEMQLLDCVCKREAESLRFDERGSA